MVGGCDAPDVGGQRRGLGLPLGRGQRLVVVADPTEGRPAAGPGDEEGPRPRHEVVRPGLARLGGVGPGDHALAAEHGTDRLRPILLQVAQGQAEHEPRPLPVEPADLAVEALLHQLLAVHRGGEGDHRIGVQVVDVRLLHEGVQRRVDGRLATTGAEGAGGVALHQVVLVHAVLVEVFEGAQPLEVEQDQAVGGERAQVPARALHGQDPHGVARDRIGQVELGRRAAAAVVGDPHVGPEPVGAGQEGSHLLGQVDRGRREGCHRPSIGAKRTRWSCRAASHAPRFSR